MRTGQGKRLKSGPPPKWAKFVVPGIVAVVVVAAVAGWWFFLRATPQKAVAGYVAAVKSGSETAAKAFLTADTIKAVDALQKQMTTEAPQMPGNFDIAMALAGRVGADSKVEIGKARMQNGVATVAVTVERGNGGQRGGRGGARPGATKSGPRGGMRGGWRRGGFQGRPREVTVKMEGGAWKIDGTREVQRFQQMLAYFASNGGQAAANGQQGGRRGQGMRRGFGGFGGRGMGGGRRWGGQRGQRAGQGTARAPAAPATPGQ